MELTFIKVYFWLALAGLVIRAVEIMGCEYPRTIEKSVGIEFFGFLWCAGFTAWAAWILWGAK